MDIKRLGRIRGVGHRITGSRASQAKTRREGRLREVSGWEFVHVMVDDHSRLAYVEVLDDLTASCAAAFLGRALAWFADRGVTVRAVMSDNGACYVAREYADALEQLRLRHLRIKPGRPRTNGKAERFIQTLLREWAYGQIYGSSDERTANLARFLERYNYRRPHGSLGKQVPASRLNNLVGNYN